MPKVRLKRLARWLGPWTPDTRLPPGVEAEDTHVPGPPGRAPIRVRTWTGDKPLAPLLLWPGLHYAGPDDPRLDRFGRVLAHAGYRVQAPFMPVSTPAYPLQFPFDSFVRKSHANHYLGIPRFVDAAAVAG